MKVPERVTVRVSCDGASDLSCLIVELTVSAGRKNPYRIYFPQTDRSGVTTLTRDDFIGQFQDHWEAGIMDYDGSPETAAPLVRVSLYDPSWALRDPAAALAWPLLPHERTKWSSREQEYKHRTSTRNADFVASSVMVDLEETSDIVLTVRRRADGDSPG
jgi:hypothetical protein